MDREAWIAVSAVAAIYVACAISVLADPAQQSQPVVTRLAMAAVITAGLSFIYFLGKLYSHQWHKLSGNSILRAVVERTLVPLVPAMFVPGLGRAMETRQWALLSVHALLFVVLMDWPRAYATVVGTWFAEPRYGDRFFYLQYPPQRRIDMLPFDIALMALLIFLFGRHFEWS
jgi:hypothetical protein